MQMYPPHKNTEKMTINKPNFRPRSAGLALTDSKYSVPFAKQSARPP